MAAPDRQPIWPAGVVGSITHTEGLCAAVVAERKLLRGIGIDTEPACSVESALWPRILIRAELDWLASLERRDRAAAATLIFSAKEAAYKCQYPSTGERLSFSDLNVTVVDWGAERRRAPRHADAGDCGHAPYDTRRSSGAATGRLSADRRVRIGWCVHAPRFGVFACRMSQLARPPLIRLVVSEYLHHGQQDDLDVQHRCPVPQVVEVEIDARLHLLELRGLAAATVDLCEAGDSRAAPCVAPCSP